MGLFSRKSSPAPAQDLSWEGVATLLRPRLVGLQVEAVRGLALPAQVRASAQIVPVPVAGDVAVGAVVDSPSGLMQVGEGLLASWGRGIEEVLEVAVSSTFGRDVEMALVAQGTYVVRDPWFAAGVARRPALAETFDVVGDVVAVFADAGWLVVTGSEDVEGLALVGELLADVVAEDDRPVSVTPLRLKDGAWEVFDLPADVANVDGWRLARARWTATRANEQAEPLSAALASEGQEVVVAPVEVVRDPHGEVITYSPLTQTVATALVRTDTVVCVGLDGSSQIRPFDEVVGDAQPLPGTNPPRWLATIS